MTVRPQALSGDVPEQTVRCWRWHDHLVKSPTANPVTEADALLLMVVLARYEGSLRGGETDDHNVLMLADRCVDVGLLDPDGPRGRDDVSQVLADIGQRLRYAIGEYPSDPTVRL